MRIVRIFFDVNMGYGFLGLAQIMRDAGMKPDAVTGHVVFINRARTKFKLFVQGYLVYYNNGNKRIPLQALQYLPQAFGGAKIDINEAMSAALLKSLKKELRIDGQG